MRRWNRLIPKITQSTKSRLFNYLLPNQKHNYKKIRIASYLMATFPELLEHIPLSFISDSQSQYAQDLVAAIIFNGKRSGTFIEAGACDGFQLSNTLTLETKLNWHGVLVEPNAHWDEIRFERGNSDWISACLSGNAGNVLFNSTTAPELSTITQYSTNDGWANLRKIGNVITTPSLTLTDLISGSPKLKTEIDFLSLDTEGSEFEILQAYDPDSYRFNLICVEHNYTSQKRLIKNLLANQFGYVPILSILDTPDSWYVHPSLIEADPRLERLLEP